MIKTGPRIPLLAGVGLAVAAPALTWWAIGPLGGEMPDHSYGPYHVSLALERVAGVAAILIAIAAAFGIATFARSRGRAPRHGMAAGTALCLVEAGALDAAGWRVDTAGVVGANIGAGFVLLVGPIAVAGLLVGAALTERQARGIWLAHSILLTCLAALVAPLLYAALMTL